MVWTHETPSTRAGARDRQAGFSILEVYAATTLLSIVIFAAMLTVVPVGRQVRINEDMDIMVTRVHDVIERINVVPFNDILTTYPPGTTITIDEVPEGSLTIDYGDVNADPLLVRVTVAWNSPDLGEVERIFATVRTE